MKRFFQSELQELRTHLVLMGEKAMQAVRRSVRALVEQDLHLAESIHNLDDAIDGLEMKIDFEAIRYISLRAPVASDLRLVVIGIKAGHELERVGDEATTIAKHVKQIIPHSPARNFLHIPHMANLALELLRDALDSFIEEDADKALTILKRDEEIDHLHSENYHQLTQTISSNVEGIHLAIGLIFVSKAIERIGDHATNIAEDVIYLLKGEDVRHCPGWKRME